MLNLTFVHSLKLCDILYFLDEISEVYANGVSADIKCL